MLNLQKKFLILLLMMGLATVGFADDIELEISTNIVSGAGKDGDTLQVFASLKNSSHETLTVFFYLSIQKPDGEVLYYPEMTTAKPSIYLIIPANLEVDKFELMRFDFGENVISEYGEYKIYCSIENSTPGFLPVTDSASFQYIEDDWFIRSESRYYVEGEMVVGDLNNDYFPDLVIGNSVMMNRGNGSFRNPVIYSAGVWISPVTLADVNRDSYLDMVMSTRFDYEENNSSVLVFLNKEDGSFENFVQYETGKGSQKVDAVDLNNDGFVDLVVGNNSSNDISVLLNRGDGTFNSDTRYDYSNYVFVDFDYDGFVDMLTILTTSNESKIILLENKGDGSFKNGFVLFITSKIYRLIPVDVNGDNVIDLISIYNDKGLKAAVNINLGDDTFERRSDFNCGEIILHDMNNDGFMDIVTEDWDYSKGGYVIFIKLNKGDGTFEDNYISFDNRIYRITTSDLNGDGFADIIASLRHSMGLGSSVNVNFAIMLNNGDGSFKSPVLYGSGGEVYIDDVNNDGFSDIIANSFGASILLNTGVFN